MKKYGFISLIIFLVLAALACTIPYFGELGSSNEPVTRSATESVTEAVTETVFVGEEKPEPTSTKSESVVPDEAQNYQINGVEITIQNSFVLGDAAVFLSRFLEGPNVLGDNVTEQIRRIYEENEDDLILFAVDTSDSSAIQTSLLVIKNEAFAGMSLGMVELFTDFIIGDTFDSMEQERLILGNRDTLRSITTVKDDDLITSQVFYLFKDAQTFWMIIFLTSNEKVHDQLTMFDEVVTSFTILSQE